MRTKRSKRALHRDVAGLAWTLIVPLATVIIYSTVFSLIFRAQAPVMGNGHDGVFAVWFFVGLVSWNVFSQARGPPWAPSSEWVGCFRRSTSLRSCLSCRRASRWQLRRSLKPQSCSSSSLPS